MWGGGGWEREGAWPSDSPRLTPSAFQRIRAIRSPLGQQQVDATCNRFLLRKLLATSHTLPSSKQSSAAKP